MQTSTLPHDNQVFSTNKPGSSSACPYSAAPCCSRHTRVISTDPGVYELQETQRKITTANGVRRCGLSVLSHSGIAVYDNGSVNFSGIKLCRRGTCFYCLRHKAIERAKQFESILQKATQCGYKAYMAVLTLRSGAVRNEELKDALVGSLSKALRKKYLDSLGVVGWCRAIETTIAQSGRFHLHCNVLLIVDPAREVVELEQTFFAKWQSSVVSLNPKCRPEVDAFYFTEVDNIESAAVYSTAVVKEKSYSKEVSLSPWKVSSYNSKSMTAYELLQDIAQTGNERSIQLFQCWEHLFFKLRRYAVSHCLEKKLDEMLSRMKPEALSDAPESSDTAPVIVKYVQTSVSAMSWIVQRRMRTVFSIIYTSIDDEVRSAVRLFEKINYCSIHGLLTPDGTFDYLDKWFDKFIAPQFP